MRSTPGAGDRLSSSRTTRNQVIILVILLFTALLCMTLLVFDQLLTVDRPAAYSLPGQPVMVTLISTWTPFPENSAQAVVAPPAGPPPPAAPAPLPTAVLSVATGDPNADNFPTPTLAPRPWQPGEPFIVQPGQSLGDIAAQVGITEDDLRAANAMYGDALLPGQAIQITGGPARYPAWRYASLDKDLSDINYPLVLDSARFRMHYMPDTFPAVDPGSVAALIERGMRFVEQSFGRPLDGIFDVYVAGTLYEAPNRYLRGKSISLDRKVFWLDDGSGDAVHQQYLAAHEMTHLYAWNTFGQPFSFLLSEGGAVYTGMKMIAGSRYMPIKDFCAGYKLENALPLLYTKTVLDDFRGHNNNLVNYFSSGCMVGYLIETYGVEKFGQVYHTTDFLTVYGKDLPVLEEEWKASIDTSAIAGSMDTGRLVRSVSRFMHANDVIYDAFDASPRMILAYRMLDRARLALLSGDFDGFDVWMGQYDDALR